MKLTKLKKTFIILCLTLYVLFSVACSEKDDFVEPDRIETQDQYKVSAPTSIDGTWYYDFETTPILNGQYARGVMTLTALPNDKLLLNGTDTLCMINPFEYVGCMQFNKLQTGALKGGVLTHCELYADHITQMSYYCCVEYRK